MAYVRSGPLGLYLRQRYGIVWGSSSCVISVVTKAELLSLAKKLRWGPSRIDQLHEILDRFLVVDINYPDIIEAYADIDFFSSTLPRSVNMQKNDLWMAATTHVLALPLLTTDRDFGHLHPDWLQREWIDESAARSAR